MSLIEGMLDKTLSIRIAHGCANLEEKPPVLVPGLLVLCAKLSDSRSIVAVDSCEHASVVLERAPISC
jgi:hypothetical protein